MFSLPWVAGCVCRLGLPEQPRALGLAEFVTAAFSRETESQAEAEGTATHARRRHAAYCPSLRTVLARGILKDMRTRRVAIALALLLVACGGSARSGDHGLPSSAAGMDGTGGDAPNSVGGQPNGDAGEPSLGATGGGGEPSSGGSEPASAGAGGESTRCVGLDCLAGAHLIYQPTRSWHAPTGAISTTGELSEADYTPMQGQPIALTFSDDALAVELQPTAGGALVLGERNPTHTDRAWYELDLFARGRFVVQMADGQFVAEHTVYGSGTPIVTSTRGTLTNSR